MRLVSDPGNSVSAALGRALMRSSHHISNKTRSHAPAWGRSLASDIGHRPSAISYQLSVIGHRPSVIPVISYPSSAISYQPSVIGHQPSNIKGG